MTTLREIGKVLRLGLGYGLLVWAARVAWLVATGGVA